MMQTMPSSLEDLADKNGVAPIHFAVNGSLMRGLKLNCNLRAVDAEFIREDITLPRYRLFSISDIYPGMYRVASGGTVAVEVWSVPASGLGTLLVSEPPGLCIGKVQLESGQEVLGVLAEPILCEGMRDITAFGGWRRYLAVINSLK